MSDAERELDMYNGRLDLRGFRFPGPNQQGEFDFHGYDIGLVNRPEYKKLAFETCDFSLANLNGVMFSKCSFDGCLFQRSRLVSTLAYDCEFRNCGFVDSDLTGTLLGGKIGRNSGGILGTEFRGGKFAEVVFSFPVIAGCTFDSNITNVDFNGSQLTDCKFTGKLDKVIFRRKPKKSTVEGLRMARTIPENRMEKVDFSEAGLFDVDFCGGVNLTKCIFPGRPGVFLVLNGQQVFVEVRGQVESSWSGEDRRIGLGYTTNYFMDRIKDGQEHFLIDEESFVEDWDESLARRYTALIRTIAQSHGVLREMDNTSHDSSSNRR